jgi:2-desacetyl-2-hydroxyethyl bacteriochlorophyllide A dehydrogenase
LTEDNLMAYITAPGKVQFKEQVLRDLEQNEVRLQVRAAAICGSDLHIYKGKHPAAALPVAVGHEIAGQVVEVGDDVTRVQVGDRVAVEPVIICGSCHFCRRGAYHLCSHISFQYRQGQGGFTRYFSVHENWAHKLPDGLSYEEGALIEPLAVAVHAVKIANIGLGSSCAIFGDGAIGLMLLMVARHNGAGDIILSGIQSHRLQMARQLGARLAIDNLEEDALAQVLELTSDLGVATAFEAVGLESTLLQSLHALKKGGTAVVLGIFEEPGASIPANLFIQKETTLKGSQGYNWDFQTAIKLVENGAVDLQPLITHMLPLEELGQGFELLLEPSQQAIKVIIRMD